MYIKTVTIISADLTLRVNAEALFSDVSSVVHAALQFIPFGEEFTISVKYVGYQLVNVHVRQVEMGGVGTWLAVRDEITRSWESHTANANAIDGLLEKLAVRND